jgi:Alginate lyase
MDNAITPPKFFFSKCLSQIAVAAGLAVMIFSGQAKAFELSGAIPRTFSADPQTLMANKAALAAGDATLKPALDNLLQDANDLLSRKPPSVMDKKLPPPSGDKHDFMSQAPYFWPDPNSPEGPYIRRDGQRNPEAGKNSDAGNWYFTTQSAHTLALAYYFTGDEKYAVKAAEFTRVWFLDPVTRMNPNLNYGQGIPGTVEGRSAGLIAGRCLANEVDAIGLLAGSTNWTAADRQGMMAWARDYLHWLRTSSIGKGEDAATNNHGTWFDVQAISMALFIGDTDYAREKLLAARQVRIDREIQPDGKMPRELARTLSFNYSLFNLTAEMQLADLANSAGVDLWHYQGPKGQSILKAVQFMSPYADPARKWPYQQIAAPSRDHLGMVLLRAEAEYPDSGLGQWLKFFDSGDLASDPQRLYLKTALTPSK